MQAPFSWFGGKSRVANIVWQRLGADVHNYVEPFCGSAAVLLARPGGPGKNETVNDADGMLVNFWRAVRRDPEAVARWAAGPPTEVDLLARNNWLTANRTAWTRWLCTDPEFYDAKTAGWWVWGQCCWIGHGWAASNAVAKLPEVSSNRGVFSERCQPDLGAVMRELADRLEGVHIACGDWSRVLTPACTTGIGTTAVFLDPPYSAKEREPGLYAVDQDVAHEVEQWAIEHGADIQMRIALCCYDQGQVFPSGWTSFRWKATGGYGNLADGRGRSNANREMVWFSPHSQPVHKTPTLFDLLEEPSRQ